MGDWLHAYLLAFYGASIVVLLVRVLPAAARVASSARPVEGWARRLPFVLLPLGFGVPPLAVASRVGELDVAWMPVRVVGFALTLCAAALLLSSAATLGRFLVPQAVVQPDHVLVTRGPYRIVRHPAYAGDLALWLGAGLATLNVVLLAAWPLYLVGAAVQAGAEERVLAARFGESYERYASRVGRFTPRLGRAGVD